MQLLKKTMAELSDFENVMFSYEAVKRISRVMGEDSIRHKLIGLGVYNGSRTARATEGDYFDRRRRITSKIIEGYYRIAGIGLRFFAGIGGNQGNQ